MLKEKHEFIFLNVRITVLVKVLEGFTDCKPLLTNLAYETVEYLVIWYEVFGCESSVKTL